jgi:hypothetical protein
MATDHGIGHAGRLQDPHCLPQSFVDFFHGTLHSIPEFLAGDREFNHG